MLLICIQSFPDEPKIQTSHDGQLLSPTFPSSSQFLLSFAHYALTILTPFQFSNASYSQSSRSSQMFPLPGVLSFLHSTRLVLILRHWLLPLPSPPQCSLLYYVLLCHRTYDNLDLPIYLWFYFIESEPYKGRDTICFIHHRMPSI